MQHENIESWARAEQARGLVSVRLNVNWATGATPVQILETFLAIENHLATHGSGPAPTATTG